MLKSKLDSEEALKKAEREVAEREAEEEHDKGRDDTRPDTGIRRVDEAIARGAFRTSSTIDGRRKEYLTQAQALMATGFGTQDLVKPRNGDYFSCGDKGISDVLDAIAKHFGKQWIHPEHHKAKRAKCLVGVALSALAEDPQNALTGAVLLTALEPADGSPSSHLLPGVEAPSLQDPQSPKAIELRGLIPVIESIDDLDLMKAGQSPIMDVITKSSERESHLMQNLDDLD